MKKIIFQIVIFALIGCILPALDELVNISVGHNIQIKYGMI
jgi:hypothetical protein